MTGASNTIRRESNIASEAPRMPSHRGEGSIPLNAPDALSNDLPLIDDVHFDLQESPTVPRESSTIRVERTLPQDDPDLAENAVAARSSARQRVHTGDALGTAGRARARARMRELFKKD